MPSSEHHLLVGNEAGELQLFDIRKPKNCIVKNDMTEKAVSKIKFSPSLKNTFGVCSETSSLRVFTLDPTLSTLDIKWVYKFLLKFRHFWHLILKLQIWGSSASRLCSRSGMAAWNTGQVLFLWLGSPSINSHHSEMKSWSSSYRCTCQANPFDVYNELVTGHHNEMANTKPHSELEENRANIVVIVLLSTTFVSQKNQGLKKSWKCNGFELLDFWQL